MFSQIFSCLSTLITFFGFYYIATNSIILDESYKELFWYYFIITSLFQIYYRTKNKSFRKITYDKFLQFIFTLFTLSMVLSLVKMDNISRVFLFQVLVVNGIIHWIISFRKILNGSASNAERDQKVNFQLEKLILSLLILCFSFISVLFHKTGTIDYYIWLEEIVLFLVGFWWVSSYITRKFYINNSKNIYYKLAPVIKSQVLFLLLSSVIFSFFKFDFLSRQLFFGSIILFSIIETTIFFFLFSSIIPSNSIQFKDLIDDQIDLHIPKENRGKKTSNLNLILKKLSLFVPDDVVDAFTKILDKLDIQIDKNQATTLSTNNSTNFQFSFDTPQKLIINLSKVNDYKNINKMFIDIRYSMIPGGYFIGCFTPLEEDYHIMREKMPKFLFIFIYPLHFIFYRIFPKLPIVNYFYYFFTKGEGRYISKAEVFGRLNYCGFKIIDSFLIRHQNFFISTYSKTESQEKNPSFGPIVKLKRLGYNKDLITIYKFRTMHPYSEFLQSDLYELGGLNDDGDKIIDDYRVTAYGKILRKFWVDELPQLVNWIRGDISLVGVRALSKAKFDLYPKDLQELRTRLKPGLIPPFYVDLPKTFGELLESERNYINKKLKSRFSTDVIYLLRAFNNIVFRGARSQ